MTNLHWVACIAKTLLNLASFLVAGVTTACSSQSDVPYNVSYQSEDDVTRGFAATLEKLRSQEEHRRYTSKVLENCLVLSSTSRSDYETFNLIKHVFVETEKLQKTVLDIRSEIEDYKIVLDEFWLNSQKRSVTEPRKTEGNILYDQLISQIYIRTYETMIIPYLNVLDQQLRQELFGPKVVREFEQRCETSKLDATKIRTFVEGFDERVEGIEELLQGDLVDLRGDFAEGRRLMAKWASGGEANDGDDT